MRPRRARSLSDGSSRDRVSKAVEVFDDRDKTDLASSSCERKLMVIDGFAMERTPRHDNRALPEGKCRDDGARARVNDDYPGASRVRAELVVRQKIHALSAPGAKPGRAALDDQLLVRGQPVDRSQETLERDRAGADGYEDHGAGNTDPT